MFDPYHKWPGMSHEDSGWDSLSGNRPEWRTLWENDRLWKGAWAAAVTLLVVLGAMAYMRGKERAIAQARASRPRPAQPQRFQPPPRPETIARPPAERPDTPPTSAPSDYSSAAAMPDRIVDRHKGTDRPSKAEASSPAKKHQAILPPGTSSGNEVPRATYAEAADRTAERPDDARRILAQIPQEAPLPGPSQGNATSVYLDDMEEVLASIGMGELGKHGATGYPADMADYGIRAIVRGAAASHLLSMHPPEQGTSSVRYGLTEDYRMFRALVGILEVGKNRSSVLRHSPFYMGEAFSPLTFRVIGNGKLLWQSRPTRKSGDWQECVVRVQGVRTLELQVDCPGPNTFAWAAWAEPCLEK